MDHYTAASLKRFDIRVFLSWLTNGKWRRRLLWAGAFHVAAWAVLWLAVTLTPLPLELAQPPAASREFTDHQGRVLRLELSPAGGFCKPIRFADCPPVFMHATLAAEDKRFWTHSGVDWLATIRALRDFAAHGRVVSGASTITQQLIKNAHPRPRTIRSKVMEYLQAMKLERTWSKKDIFTAYVNRIDYGNLCRGAGTASWYYLGKPLRDVSVGEAALLASLPNTPSRLNPHRYMKRAQKRQRFILTRMRNNSLLDYDAWQRARSEPLVLRPSWRKFKAPHLVEFIRQQRSVKQGGLTTIDLDLNRVARRLLNNQLSLLSEKNVTDGAVVVIENATGNVLALVGSRNFFNPHSGQVNGAWAPRSAGSTFKPFAYLLALEKGMTPATLIADVPTIFATPTGIFAPQNYNRQFHGPILFRRALAASLNIPAVKILKNIGGAVVLQDRLRECGLTTLQQEAAHYGLGLAIGNAETRLLELANAYACLARMGIHRPYRLLATDPTPSWRVFSHRASWLIADILKDNDARSLAFGLHSPLRFDFPVACKTGTSSDFRDNWALGYTPEFTVAVWMGNFDGSYMRNVSGVTGAAPVMNELMTHLHHQKGTSWFPRPEGLTRRSIHEITGKLQPHGQGEWFVAEHLPSTVSAVDFDANDRILLAQEYAGWFASGQNTLVGRISLATKKPTSFRLLAPLPGTLFYWDPNVPAASQSVRLMASEPDVQWTSSTLECINENGHTFARLKPGRHQLLAETINQRRQTWITVERR